MRLLKESQNKLKIAMESQPKLCIGNMMLILICLLLMMSFMLCMVPVLMTEGGYKMSSEAYARKFIPPEDSDIVANETVKALETDDPNYLQNFDHKIIRRDGEERYISVRFGIIKDSKGRTIKTYGANQDITERKKAEEALIETKNEKSKILEILNEAQKIAKIGSWDWDMETNELWWSDETYQIFGVDMDYEPSFESNKKFIHPDDLENYQKQFEHSY